VKSVEERFWEKVDKRGSEDCWVWTAAKTSGGYGNFTINKKNFPAHRISYVWQKGEIAQGLHLDHLCRNRACVNPSHLEPVTQRENILRGLTIPAKNAQKSHCAHGHLYDIENTYICNKGQRHCRECRRLTSNNYYHKVVKKRAVAE
jgi:hypothetical protein